MKTVGIDVGGTFTYAFLFDENTGEYRTIKVSSTPGAETRGVLNALEKLGADLRQVRRVLIGTTVATNTYLERNGAPVGLVTTEGFRDMLEIGRGQRLSPGSVFHSTYRRPKPLVPRPLRQEVSERTLADGSVETELTFDNVRTVAEVFDAAGCSNIAVCLLHSYANDSQEKRVRDYFTDLLPDASVTISSEVVPEYREYERLVTTVVNAYVSPSVTRTVEHIEQEVQRNGLAGRVFVMSSSGSIMSCQMASRLPVRSMLSGPVGGVVGAVYWAEKAGVRDLISYDMGGTSSDVCLVKDLRPNRSNEMVLAGFPIKTMHVEINSVGAGGGSIASLDELNALQVGPRSAGAVPGPACYGRGGLEATVSDANVVLGRMNPKATLGEEIPLVSALAMEAVGRIGDRLGNRDTHNVADGIVRIATVKMAGAIREISLERGHDTRDFTLVAFGGAGPMHAAPIAEELQIKEVLIPPHPGNVSAFGAVASDAGREYVKTLAGLLREVGLDRVLETVEELKGTARFDAERDDFDAEGLDFASSLDMRYEAQAFELGVPVSPSNTIKELISDFHQRHRARYGYALEDREVQLVNVRLSAISPVVKPSIPLYESKSASLGEALIEKRNVYFGGMRPCPVYRRERLPALSSFNGPAIVEESGSTSVLPPGWRLSVDSYGVLHMSKGA